MVSNLNPRAAPFVPNRLYPAILAEIQCPCGSLPCTLCKVSMCPGHEPSIPVQTIISGQDSNPQEQGPLDLPPIRYATTGPALSSVANTYIGLQRFYLGHFRELEILKEAVRKFDGQCFLALKQLRTQSTVPTVLEEIEEVIRVRESLEPRGEVTAVDLSDSGDEEKDSILGAYEEPEKSTTSIPLEWSKKSSDEVLLCAKGPSFVNDKDSTEGNTSEKYASIGFEGLMTLLQLLRAEQAETRDIYLKVTGQLEKARRQVRELVMIAGVEIVSP